MCNPICIMDMPYAFVGTVRTLLAQSGYGNFLGDHDMPIVLDVWKAGLPAGDAAVLIATLRDVGGVA